VSDEDAWFAFPKIDEVEEVVARYGHVLGEMLDRRARSRSSAIEEGAVVAARRHQYACKAQNDHERATMRGGVRGREEQV